MTRAEQKLWAALRGQRLGGLTFRARYAAGPFILDFYCPACKLVIEMVGPSGSPLPDEDGVRSRYLHEYGYHVIQVHRDEVLTNLPSVLERISRVADEIGLPARSFWARLLPRLG